MQSSSKYSYTWKLLSNRFKISKEGEKNYKDTKKHWIVHSKWVGCMVNYFSKTLNKLGIKENNPNIINSLIWENHS